MLKKTLLTLAVLAAAASAHAHELWIEQTGTAARVYFGEPDEATVETSPGALDKFVGVGATLITAQGDKTLTPQKAYDAFVLPGRAAPGESVIAYADYPVYDAKKDNVVTPTAWKPAARFINGWATQAPKLVLDVTPTGQPGQFKVTFKGQPLAKTKVSIAQKQGWGRDGFTDEAGLVKFELPFDGRYMVVVSRQDPAGAGEVGGKKHTAASYLTTLTLVQEPHAH